MWKPVHHKCGYAAANRVKHFEACRGVRQDVVKRIGRPFGSTDNRCIVQSNNVPQLLPFICYPWDEFSVIWRPYFKIT
jgi:hypothetical protein